MIPLLPVLLLALVATVHASPLAAAVPKDLRARQAISWPPGQSYQSVVLAHHNAHRANHSAANLTWGPVMFANAKTHAQRCIWQHNTSIGGQVYGQNLAAGYMNMDVGVAISQGWYGSEEPFFAGQFGLASPDLSKFESFGHYTQVVWAATQTVGCMTYNCGLQGGLKDSSGNVLQGLDYFTVCNYWPVGNMLGAFGSNVHPSLNLPPYTAYP